MNATQSSDGAKHGAQQRIRGDTSSQDTSFTATITTYAALKIVARRGDACRCIYCGEGCTRYHAVICDARPGPINWEVPSTMCNLRAINLFGSDYRTLYLGSTSLDHTLYLLELQGSFCTVHRTRIIILPRRSPCVHGVRCIIHTVIKLILLKYLFTSLLIDLPVTPTIVIHSDSYLTYQRTEMSKSSEWDN